MTSSYVASTQSLPGLMQLVPRVYQVLCNQYPGFTSSYVASTQGLSPLMQLVPRVYIQLFLTRLQDPQKQASCLIFLSSKTNKQKDNASRQPLKVLREYLIKDCTCSNLHYNQEGLSRAETTGHPLSFGVCIFKARHVENEKWSWQANHSIVDEQALNKLEKPLSERSIKSLCHACIGARDTEGFFWPKNSVTYTLFYKDNTGISQNNAP